MTIQKICRRLVSLLLITALVLPLSACGGKGSNSGSGGQSGSGSKSTGQESSSMPSVSSKDGVVRATQINIGGEGASMDGLQILAMEDGTLYAVNSYFDMENGSGFELIRFGSDGGDPVRTPLSFGEDDEIIASAYLNGSYYIAAASYSDSEAKEYAEENDLDADDEIPDDLSEDATSVYTLQCYSPDGTRQWSSTLQEPAGDEYFYVNDIVAAEDSLLVTHSSGVDRYSSADGSFQESVCTVDSSQMAGTLYALQDGTIVMLDEYSGNSVKALVYDTSKKEFSEAFQLPAALTGATLFPGKQYAFYAVAEDGIYGVSQDGKTITAVVNYVNSDLDIQAATKVLELEDGKLIVQAYGLEDAFDLYLLEPVAPEDVEDKKELVLGGYYIEYEVRSEVIKFNKENPDYRITLLDYSQYDLEDDDYDNPTGLTKMNTDIVTGNTPDLMILNDVMPVDSYISKGVFADLTQYFESDSGIDRSDFLQNIVDAFRTDGKMYVAVPAFYVSCLLGKEKFIGTGNDLTIDRIRQIAADNNIPEEKIFGITDRDTVFQSAIEFSGSRFIDHETGTCDFDNEEFRKLLAFANIFPQEIKEDDYDDMFTQYLGDQALLCIQYVSTIYDYEYFTRQLFGDANVNITGFPSDENSGAAIGPAYQFAISSSTKDPDGCWDFVRRFFLSDYQKSIESYMPISESAIDAQGKELIEDIREQREMELAYLNGEDYTGTDAAEEIPEIAYDDVILDDGSGDEADTGATGAAASEEADAFIDEEDEYYESGDLTGMPVERDAFDGTDEEYEQYLQEFDESGETADESDDGLNLPDFSEEDVAKFKTMLKSLTVTGNTDQNVINIITEEAEAYFAGQKSAEEVSEVIQSRVQVYLNENE